MDTLTFLITLGGRTSIHCAGGWALLGVLTALRAGVIIGYLVIARDWRRREKTAASNKGIQALGELREIFTWCSICGYLAPIVMALVPVYSINIIALAYLNWRTWRYVGHLSDLQIVYSNKAAELLEHIVNGHYEHFRDDKDKLAAIQRDIRKYLEKV